MTETTTPDLTSPDFPAKVQDLAADMMLSHPADALARAGMPGWEILTDLGGALSGPAGPFDVVVRREGGVVSISWVPRDVPLARVKVTVAGGTACAYHALPGALLALAAGAEREARRALRAVRAMCPACEVGTCGRR